MKRRLLFSIVLLLLLAAWANGCGGEPISVLPYDESRVVLETGDAGTDVPTPEPQRKKATMTPVPTSAATEVEPPAKAEQASRLAREDLARRLGLAPEAIRLVSVEAVEWSDTSLGCPQPGMMYAQVITSGFWVVLEAKRQKYQYHTDAGRFVVLCRGEGLPIEPVPLMPVAPHGIPGKPRMAAD